MYWAMIDCFPQRPEYPQSHRPKGLEPYLLLAILFVLPASNQPTPGRPAPSARYQYAVTLKRKCSRLFAEIFVSVFSGGCQIRKCHFDEILVNDYIGNDISVSLKKDNGLQFRARALTQSKPGLLQTSTIQYNNQIKTFRYSHISYKNTLEIIVRGVTTKSGRYYASTTQFKRRSRWTAIKIGA